MSTTITGSPTNDEVVKDSQVASHNGVIQGLTPNGFLMESYTSGNWTVTKWADGRMEMEYIVTTATARNYATGSLYGTLSESFTFPETFIARPSMSGCELAVVGNSWVSLGSGAVSTTGGTFEVYGAVSSGFKPMVSLHFIGRWK